MAAAPRTTASQDPTTAPTAWWGDRTVKAKILATVGVSAVVTATVGVLGIQALSSAAGAADDMYAKNMQGVIAAAEMDGLLTDIRINGRDTVLAVDPADAPSWPTRTAVWSRRSRRSWTGPSP